MELKIIGTIELEKDELAFDAVRAAALKVTRTSADLERLLNEYAATTDDNVWPLRLAILEGGRNDIPPNVAYKQLRGLSLKDCSVSDMLRVIAVAQTPAERRTVFLHEPFRKPLPNKPGRFRSYVMLYDDMEVKARLLRTDNPPIPPDLYRGKVLVSYIARML